MATRRDKRARVATGEDRGGGDGSTVDGILADMQTELVALQTELVALRSESKTNSTRLQEILVLLRTLLAREGAGAAQRGLVALGPEAEKLLGKLKGIRDRLANVMRKVCLCA